MRNASFDTPAAMGSAYGTLRTLGFKPRNEAAPAEWVSPAGEYIRFAHVAGWTECWYQPEGKRVPSSYYWRINRAYAPLSEFLAWTSTVLNEILVVRPCATCLSLSSSTTPAGPR